MSITGTYKIITGGDGGVGKTTLIRRYVEGQFDFETKMTIGVEIFNKNVELPNGDLYALQLWDFGGQERFRFFLDSFVLGANGAFIMFDLTRPQTFFNIKNWIPIIQKYDPKIPMILLGSKFDLKHKILVDDSEVEELMNEYGFLDYLKVSSKSGFNVSESFIELTSILAGVELEKPSIQE